MCFKFKNEAPEVLFIAGPTAVGKTACAIAMAHALKTQIISADSVQVYRHMDIGSAKPTIDERQGIPHHFIDILEPDEPYSAALFSSQAQAIIEAIQEDGRLPIVCGGTGFYLHALLYPLDFGGQSTDACLREELQTLAAANPSALYERLQRIDPKAAEKLHVNDTRRLIRAIEMAELGAGKGQAFRAMKPRYRASMFCLTMPREQLYARIDSRVDSMMQKGLADEVARLLGMDNVTRSSASMQALGYRQIAAALDGEMTMAEAVEKIKRNTRRFAKRQMTWFRHEKNTIYIDVSREKNMETVIERIHAILNQEAEGDAPDLF